MVVWSLGRVPSRIPQRIPPRKLNTPQLRKLPRRHIAEPVVIFCDNNGAIAQAKEPRSHYRSKHILRCYHLLGEMVSRGDCRMDRVSSAENTADPLTKPISLVAHTQHLDKMGLRSMGD
ncbi:UNVERIFIED_CONTAM: Retrovirus-related Pol polyprotein from transposon RE2 [Sesamum latifolium]|uniref:Retrovirus-related Pol polyprotein from transposon RE2 n=1 Tax=Sesamum latifolium TaxID=2727402 RepID=A0AAW2XMT4_9LAMI